MSGSESKLIVKVFKHAPGLALEAEGYRAPWWTRHQGNRFEASVADLTVRLFMRDRVVRNLKGLNADLIHFVDFHPDQEELNEALSRIIVRGGEVLIFGEHA